MCLFWQGPPRRPLPKAFFHKDYRDTNRSSHCWVEQWRSRLSGMMAQRPSGTVLSETPDPGAATLTQAATSVQWHSFHWTVTTECKHLGRFKQGLLFLSQFWRRKLKAESCWALLWVPLQEGMLPCLLQILLALVFLGVWKQFSRKSLQQHMVSLHSSPPPSTIPYLVLPLSNQPSFCLNLS